MFDVFLSYAKEDQDQALRLYSDLKKFGLRPWLDREEILGGEDWRLAISRGIRDSKYFIALISSHSVLKEGYVQKEIREAMEIWDTKPESRIYLIPVRLDDSTPSHHRLERAQWIDLFRGYNDGLIRILRSLAPDKAKELERRTINKRSRRASAPIAPISAQTTYSSTALAIAYETSPAENIIEVNRRLELLARESSADYQMVQNFYSESRLPETVYQHLVLRILDAEPNPKAIRKALIDECRRHLLKGQQVSISRPKLLGAFRSLDNLAQDIVLQGLATTMVEARHMLLYHAESGGPAGRSRSFMLGHYISWATFDPDGGRPFKEVGLTIDNILCSFGRPRLVKGDALVLLEYEPTDETILLIPTFCDFYASDFWDTSFRVAPPNVPYGLSVPSSDCPEQGVHPEVVHRPLRINMRKIKMNLLTT